MMQKVLWFLQSCAVALVVLLMMFGLKQPVMATEPATKPGAVVVFVREGCQHCADEKAFWAAETTKNPQLQVQYISIDEATGRSQWEELTTRTKTSRVTPLTVIGTQLIIGFSTADTTGKTMLEQMALAQKNGVVTDISKLDVSSVNQAEANLACPDDGSVPCKVEAPPIYISLPFVGSVAIAANQYPLVVLAAVLGFVDGFNPCAMWVLVTFMLILLKVGDRKKMAIFAGVFVLAEAVMYYLIMTVWFATWDFVKLDSWVTPIVGLIAIGGGLFFLYEAYTTKPDEDACKVTNQEQRHTIYLKIKQLAAQPFGVATFVGILLLAFSVNVIEFACSIGVPQAFTKILELNNLSFFGTQALVWLYIAFYMVDDFVVFGLALWGADKLQLTTKYGRLTSWVGGTIMVVLGLVLLFKPSLMVFN